jgi:dihydroorotase
LANGTIDAICSDHQPHDLDAKLGAFPETESGVSALETLLPLSLDLATHYGIALTSVIASLTQKPAKILGLSAGALTPEFSADICVFDPNLSWQVNSQTLLATNPERSGHPYLASGLFAIPASGLTTFTLHQSKGTP